MAVPAFVQSATAATYAQPVSCVPTWSGATTAGNTLVACFSARSPGAGTLASAVVPPAGLGWTQAVTTSVSYGTGGGRWLMEGWYCPNAASQSGGQTWTCSNGVYMGSASTAVSMLEYSGIDTVSPLDKSASAVSPNDNVSLPYTHDTTAESGTTATLSQSNEIAVAFMTAIVNLSDPSGGFTERVDGGTAIGSFMRISASDLTVSSTTAVNTSSTYTPENLSLGVIMTFKFTAAGPAGHQKNILTLGVG